MNLHDFPDTNPDETAEWREAFEALLAAEGPARARYILDQLAHRARDPQVLGIGFAGVALAFGLTVLTMAYAVGIFPAATLIRRYRWVCLSAAVLKAKNCCLIFLRK